MNSLRVDPSWNNGSTRRLLNELIPFDIKLTQAVSNLSVRKATMAKLEKYNYLYRNLEIIHKCLASKGWPPLQEEQIKAVYGVKDNLKMSNWRCLMFFMKHCSQSSKCDSNEEIGPLNSQRKALIVILDI